LIKTLKETGQYDNTLIVFMADNGASPEEPFQPGYDRTAETRDGERLLYEPQKPPLDIIGSEKSCLGIGAAWANAANTPFRYWKKEGGANTPCILSWPEGLHCDAGSITDAPAHIMDVMPTCLELAQQEYPETYQGNPLLPLEGKSLAGLLRGGTVQEKEECYFEHERGRAARKAGWKLVAPSDKPEEWELFHIEDDLTEMNNLAETYPEKAKALQRDWEAWAKRVGVQ